MIRNVKDRQLVIASKSKKHGGKTYFVKCDDYNSLNALAKLRGYKSKRQLLEDN